MRYYHSCYKRWVTRLSLELCFLSGLFLVAQRVKNLPAIQETWGQFLGQEDSLEKGMATHSSILAWRIPWTEEPGGLQYMGSQRVRHDWVTNIFVYQSIIKQNNSLLFFQLCKYISRHKSEELQEIRGPWKAQLILGQKAEKV